MTIPQEYCPKGENLSMNLACRLHKSLYGLKQALWKWYMKFNSALLEENFQQTIRCLLINPVPVSWLCWYMWMISS